MNSPKQRSVGSVEVTARILSAMLEGIEPKPLKDIAKAAGLSPARLHPYLVSLIKTGFIEQDASTSHYDLGPMALRLGAASLQKIEPVRVAVPFAKELAKSIGHTVALAVWTNGQATIVHLEEAHTPIKISLRHGAVMSLSQTATGLLFAAYLEPQQLERALSTDQHLAQFPERLPIGFLARPKIDTERLQTRLMRIRKDQIAVVRNTAIQGVGAMSCPIFDHTRQMLLAITCIGLSATLDTDKNSEQAIALQLSSRKISHQLGFTSPDFISKRTS